MVCFSTIFWELNRALHPHEPNVAGDEGSKAEGDMLGKANYLEAAVADGRDIYVSKTR